MLLKWSTLGKRMITLWQKFQSVNVQKIPTLWFVLKGWCCNLPQLLDQHFSSWQWNTNFYGGDKGKWTLDSTADKCPASYQSVHALLLPLTCYCGFHNHLYILISPRVTLQPGQQSPSPSWWSDPMFPTVCLVLCESNPPLVADYSNTDVVHVAWVCVICPIGEVSFLFACITGTCWFRMQGAAEILESEPRSSRRWYWRDIDEVNR